ncbi:MAG TPA: ParB N-terminal domain-containing protein [Candidatus Angelobacter sp.]|nr:ParB N-terminal domain-containing protein [Candidatus Angelobacter sp.]
MPPFKRREPSSSSAADAASSKPKSASSRSRSSKGAAGAPSKPSPATETATLEQWVAPSTSSSIDQVEVSLIDLGWEPERVGQAPLEATLAAIQAVGVVEPVLLRPRAAGRFEVVTGHRTMAAARAAGMERVPSVVKDLDDVGALMALVFDGSASGQVTAAGAAELRRRLRAAGAGEEDIEDVLAAVPAAAETAAEVATAEPELVPVAEPELVPVAEPLIEAGPELVAELIQAAVEAAPTAEQPVPAAGEDVAPEAEAVPVAADTAIPQGEPLPAAEGTVPKGILAAEPEPVAVEIVAAEPEPQPVAEELVAAEPEPEPVAEEVVAAEPEPEPVAEEVVAAAPEPEPAPAPEPEREPALAATAARSSDPEGADSAWAGRWLPMPAGRPRLARLSSAFADAPKMLGILATDRFTGTAELVGRDGRKDTVAFLDGRILATYVEQGQRQVDAPLRLPSPDRGPTVEITVRPHPRAVSVALALALRSPARFTGLHAAFLHLDGLLALLRREGSDAACVVTSSKGTGVILLDAGQPVAAYARRWGDEPGEEAETTDVSAVLDMLVSGDGAVDVHTGDVPEPLELDAVIARAVPGD